MENNNFNQTVDLRKAAQKKKSAEPLEEIYRGGLDDFAKISRPAKDIKAGRLIRAVVLGLAVILVASAVYVLSLQSNASSKADWYAVKLADGMIYYGQVSDVAANPLNIKNVYYDYDQAKTDASKETKSAGANLRLVKRGQETAGGDGSISVYQTNVIYLEPLAADSKILKAILDYEK